MTRRMYPPAKRAVDLLIGTLLLVLLGWLLVLLAALVLLTMGRPVLFRQVRPGRDGEPFELMKFRTMRSGGESDAERLTPVGRFLRSTSLDELPELWHVVTGEMSLIGPRPLLMEYLPLYDARQATRHAVRPGLTGLAQVSGRNQLPWDERLELDAAYVERLSFALDVKIAWLTLLQVVRRDGISAEGEATVSRFTGSTGTRT